MLGRWEVLLAARQNFLAARMAAAQQAQAAAQAGVVLILLQ